MVQNKKKGAIQKATERALTTTGKPTTLEQMLKSAAADLGRVLPRSMNAERLIQIALTAIRQTPKLAQCTQSSFLGALLVSAQLNLEPVAGRAYLIPFRNKNGLLEVQFVVGYKGLAELFYRHRKSVGLSWGTVREGDQFEYEYGTNEYLRHVPAPKADGTVLGYYVVAELRGTKKFMYMTKEACITHGKKHSKTYDHKTKRFDPSSPWHTDENLMCLKTVLIQLGKVLPLSIEIQMAIASDETSRDYRPGMGEPLDIPAKPWEGEVIEGEVVPPAAHTSAAKPAPGGDYLIMGSDLHKAVEAMIKEEGWDRNLVHQYLLEKGKIDLVEGHPSFSSMLISDARAWLDTREKFKPVFAKWVNDMASGGQQEEMFK